MSDRRLSNPELCKHADSLIVQRNYGHRWVTCTECHTNFLPESDLSFLVARVRRGVESGTIKGKVMRECEHGLLHEIDPDTEGWDLRCPFNDSDVPCRVSVTLVIPVSDGGSET